MRILTIASLLAICFSLVTAGILTPQATSYSQIIKQDTNESQDSHDLKNNQDDRGDYFSEPKYEFKYGVKDFYTGDIKDQWEERNGDRVQGGYSMKEADGSTRIVEYMADDHFGFRAIVKRIGLAYKPVLPYHDVEY